MGMKSVLGARGRLQFLLWFLAIHSFFIGVGLILLPESAMNFFGLESYTEKFFPVQGGIFHIVLSICYALAAVRIDQFDGLILFAILAKFIAAIFLFTYYLFVKQAWVILISAIGDGLMGAVVLLAFLSYRPNIRIREVM
jgi:hypothetical protein